ncbi:unnamed protein product, partial [Lampetra fluviatilis]
MSAVPPPRLSGPSFAVGGPGRPAVGRPLSANVRKLHGALGSLLSDSERMALLGRLREYQARRNVRDLVTALRDLRLDCPPRRHLLPLLRQVLPAADQLLFDTYTSRGSCLGQQQGAAAAARDGGGGGGATATLPIRAVPPQASVRRVLLERGSRGAPAPLGLSVRGGAEHGLPVAVGHVVPGSLAWRCGLRPGDLVLRANGVVLHDGVTHQDAVRVLCSGRRLDLTVLSVPPAAKPTTAGAAAPPPPPHHRHRTWGDEWWGHVAEAGGGGGPPLDRPGGGVDAAEAATLSAPSAEERGGLRLLSNGDERKVSVFPASGRAPLGLVVRGGCDFGLGIFVSGLDPGGAAESAGLQVGDQIVEVNGRSLRSASHAEAVAALGASAHLMLTVRDVGRLPRAPAVPPHRSAQPPRRRTAADDDAEPAPRSLLQDVRALVSARDLDEFDSLLPRAELLAHAGRRPPVPFPADVASVALSSSPSSVALSLAKRGSVPGGSVSSSGASSVIPLAMAVAAASSSPSSARPSDPGYSSASRGRGSPLRRRSSSSSPSSSSSSSSSPPASPSSRRSGKAPNGGAARPRTLVLPRATSPTVPPHGTGSLPPAGPGEPGSRSPVGPAGLKGSTTPGVAVVGREERRNVRFVTVEVHRPNAEPDVNEATALPRSRGAGRAGCVHTLRVPVCLPHVLRVPTCTCIPPPPPCPCVSPCRSVSVYPYVSPPSPRVSVSVAPPRWASPSRAVPTPASRCLASSPCRRADRRTRAVCCAWASCCWRWTARACVGYSTTTPRAPSPWRSASPARRTSASSSPTTPSLP